MTIELDENGQSVTARLHKTKNLTRDINELIGICRGIVFDSEINLKEAESLYAWLHSQPELINTWPANTIYSRLKDALIDGQLDEKKAAGLLSMLNEVVAQPDRSESIDTATGEVLSEVASSVLPETVPSEFSINGNSFVFTGKFSSATRAECQAEINDRGGFCQKNPTKDTRFLVIGSVGSRDWVHSSWGRKIEKAVELRESGQVIDILSEKSWLKLMESL